MFGLLGEEVDMDLSAMDDSPVLWIRLDPEMTLLRSVVIEQPDYQWQYQLRHERDVTAQMEAILALERYPTPPTRLALTDTIENEQCFYKVRLRAAHCLTKVTARISYLFVHKMFKIFVIRLQMQWYRIGLDRLPCWPYSESCLGLLQRLTLLNRIHFKISNIIICKRLSRWLWQGCVTRTAYVHLK